MMGQVHNVAATTGDWALQFALQRLTGITYQKLICSIDELNNISESGGASGKHLMFHIKKGTDKSIFWRHVVRIVCYKVSTDTGGIESARMLTLQQFMQLYYAIRREVSMQESVSTSGVLSNSHTTVSHTDHPVSLDASIIMTEIDALYGSQDVIEEECVICMDRKAQLILPCLHSYCEQCIDTWQGNNRTCPICRAKVQKSGDSWLLVSEKPTDGEMMTEATHCTMNLFDRLPTVDPDAVDNNG